MAAAEPVCLTDTMATQINGALSNGKPVIVTYVDEKGQPRISFRGSTQVFSEDQLAIWVREPEGGLIASVVDRPRMTLMYREPESRTTYILYGRGRVADDVATRQVVYDNSPQSERDRDADRRGRALVIDLDLVQGNSGETRVLMERPS